MLKSRFFYNITFFLCFVSLFILNNNRKDPANLIILNSLLSFFTLIFIFLLPVGLKNILKWKLPRSYLILIALMIISTILCFISRQYIIVHWLYLLIYLFILIDRNGIQLNIKMVKILTFFCYISLLIQLAIFDLDGRPVLSYIDTNYSSMMIFLFGAFCFYKVNKKLAVLVFILGLFTLSRAYLLVVFCFYFLHFASQYSDLFKRWMLFFTKPLISIIVIVSLPLAINFYFVATQSVENLVVNTADTKLTGSMIDRSNFDRSMASVMFVAQVVTEPRKYMFGVDIDSYLDNVFKNSPHHSIFQMILNYGWAFTLPYVLLLFSLARRACLRDNRLLPFYLSYFIYIMTLGGGVFGMPLILLAFIFSKTANNKSKKVFKGSNEQTN